MTSTSFDSDPLINPFAHYANPDDEIFDAELVDVQLELDIDGGEGSPPLEDTLVYDSLRSYLKAFRDGRKATKVRQRNKDDEHRKTIAERVNTRLKTGANLDIPEPDGERQTTYSQISEDLLSQRAALNQEIRKLGLKKIPTELKNSPMGIKRQKHEDKLRKKLQNVERKLSKSVSGVGSESLESIRVETPDFIEQPELPFPVEGVTVYAKGELKNSASKPAKVFVDNLPLFERHKIINETMAAHEARRKAEIEAIREARRGGKKGSPTKEGLNLREVTPPIGYDEYFTPEEVARLDKIIEEAIKPTAREARIAAGDVNKNLPKAEFSALIKRVQMDEILEFLPEDAPEDAVSELEYALFKRAVETGKIPRTTDDTHTSS